MSVSAGPNISGKCALRHFLKIQERENGFGEKKKLNSAKFEYEPFYKECTVL